MKFKAMLLGLSVITALPAFAQKPVYLDTGKPIEERVKDALNRMTLEEKVKMIHAQSKFSSAGVPRLGIPEVWATDGPHGIRPEVLWDEWDQAGWTNDSCIAYPALTCLSATWNPEMSHLYGKSIGEEARYRKKDILLGPGVNIYRTPLNGRNFEYMGEDPYLSATMVVPYIKGVQENGDSTVSQSATGEVCTTPNRLFTMAWTWSLVHGRTDCLPEREMRMIIITLLSLT